MKLTFKTEMTKKKVGKTVRAALKAAPAPDVQK